MKKIKLLYCIAFTSGFLLCQKVTLEGQFYPYSTYYISSFNLATGESNVPIFRYKVSSDSYPIYVNARFRATFLSPQLGISNRTVLIDVESNTFQMKADLVLDSKNFSENTTSLIDEGSPPNVIPIFFKSLETIDVGNYDNVLSNIMSTGKLPDGEYRFELSLSSGVSEFDLSSSDEKIETIIVESPSGVNLESPGGSLADTTFNIVYTTLPSFNWNKGFCSNCVTYIRVSEFKSEFHSSLDEALEDERTLPFNQSLEWEQLSDVSTFQYPLNGVRPLENGKIYVWQIKTSIPTTDGMEDETSEIFAFKISDPSKSSQIGIKNPTLQQLKESLGADKFNSLFGDNAPLQQYRPTGEYLINGSSVDQSTINNILIKIKNKKIKVNSIRVEND